MSINANGEPQLNPMDFMDHRSIDAAHDVVRLIIANGGSFVGTGLDRIARAIDNHFATAPEIHPELRWRDTPTMPGWWVSQFDDNRCEAVCVHNPADEPMDRRYFGPIPTDPMRE